MTYIQWYIIYFYVLDFRNWTNDKASFWKMIEQKLKGIYEEWETWPNSLDSESKRNSEFKNVRKTSANREKPQK